MIEPYTKEIEKQMQELYNRFSEKNRRLYAGIEALKLPYGGVSYIARLFSCSRDTVLRGIKELKEEETLDKNRERKEGGGRKTVFEKYLDIDEVFLLLLKEHTAGDPMDEKVKWTNLTCAEMVDLLSGKGFKVSCNIVKKLLKKHGYVKRFEDKVFWKKTLSSKALKKKCAKQNLNRNAQFERITELKELYKKEANPVLSVDTKKKEMIGNLFREGKIYTTFEDKVFFQKTLSSKTIEVFDHDFPSLAEGVAIPHTIYDIERNEAYVNIGTSRDTSERVIRFATGGITMENCFRG